jgi:uncharacterized repeat protein (TIGR03847 family)
LPGEQYDFGRVEFVDAEAIGPPGQRRFRLTAIQDDRSASLWIEKEQLASLGTAVEQQLVRSARAQRRASSPGEDVPTMPLNATVDFQVTQIALGYDADRGEFLVQVMGADPDRREQPTFACRIDHEQARRLTARISQLMTSGRPICPLCGAPMEGTHRCPRSNGHAEVVLG